MVRGILFALCLCHLKVVPASSDKTTPPNIIFILVDDVGWADFNYTTSQETAIPTPHIDKLAKLVDGLYSNYSIHFYPPFDKL